VIMNAVRKRHSGLCSRHVIRLRGELYDLVSAAFDREDWQSTTNLPVRQQCEPAIRAHEPCRLCQCTNRVATPT
jgi:hypothetical protein